MARAARGRTSSRRAAVAVALCCAALLAPTAGAAGAPAGTMPLAASGATPLATPAATTRHVLQARPAEVDFRTKRVGTENYRRTRITNTSRGGVVLLVTAGLPDDFGFGLMPGQTCPVFDPGEVLAAGDSCYAVVRFSPTAGFIGWDAVGELLATAKDPATAAVVDTLSIPVLGTAVP